MATDTTLTVYSETTEYNTVATLYQVGDAANYLVERTGPWKRADGSVEYNWITWVCADRELGFLRGHPTVTRLLAETGRHWYPVENYAYCAEGELPAWIETIATLPDTPVSNIAEGENRLRGNHTARYLDNSGATVTIVVPAGADTAVAIQEDREEARRLAGAFPIACDNPACDHPYCNQLAGVDRVASRNMFR